MIFTTLTFGLFVSLVFGLYWSVRSARSRNTVIVAASYFFYAWWDWRFCSLMLLSTSIDYAVGRGLASSEDPTRRRLLVGASLASNLGLLGFFKYFGFFAESFVRAMNSISWPVHPVELDIVLPVGISFYTFQTLGYSLDVYRRQLPATHSFLDYAAYVSFFPQLVAGPIERGARLLPQLHSARRFDEVQARSGLRQILWGVFKKMVIADNLATVVDPVFATSAEFTGPVLGFATLCFAFQIYCDFSGYSDIAIGTARLFGIELMQNFAYPYFSQSPREFWRRWHISLSSWFRDYVYIPLGGNRGAAGRRAWNLVLTFVASGFWHGAGWNFGLWGALHGAAVAVSGNSDTARRRTSDIPGGEASIPAPAVLLRILSTFALVCLGWVFFRAASLSETLRILQRMAADLLNPSAYASMAPLLADARVLGTLIHLAVFVMVEWIQRRHPHPLEIGAVWRPLRWLIYTALVLDVAYFGTRSANPFLYFQF